MSKIEYTIYCIWNGGTPFYLHTYDSIFKAKQDLYEMIELEKKRNRIYYVDNDFYENEYPCTIPLLIFFHNIAQNKSFVQLNRGAK